MKLALDLPWSTTNTTISPTYPVKGPFNPDTATLGDTITALSQVALYAGGFLMFIWAAWGVFDYIRAEGNKENLAKARKKIQWAIAGFIILLLASFLSDFLKSNFFIDSNDTFYDLGGKTLNPISDPTK